MMVGNPGVNPIEADLLTRPDGLAPRLRALRLQAGLKGQDLARATSWTGSKVSKLENGRQRPSAADLETWCAVCDAPGETRGLLAKLDEVHAQMPSDGQVRGPERRWAPGRPTPTTKEQRALIARAGRVHRKLAARDYLDGRLIADRRQAVLEAREAGASLQAIADGFGVSREAIRQIVVKARKDRQQ
jgi:transcriptional regulator with XRE-family HTH domain